MHKLLLSDLIAEYSLLEENSALNLIYLLGWNTHNSGGLPLAGTDERLHVVGGNDLVIHRMADELPVDTIETGRQILAIQGEYDGPYTLVFDTGPDEICDKLVMAMPYNLIKDLDIDIRITNQMSPLRIQSFNEVLSSDNGKVQMEFTERHWDMVQ